MSMGLITRLRAAGERRAARRAESLAAVTAARLADTVAARAENDLVVLRGPGLAARLFGTRRRAPDAALWRLIGGWR